MTVERVLVSPDRHWRVDIHAEGRVEIREHGFLRATGREMDLEPILRRLGLALSDLVED